MNNIVGQKKLLFSLIKSINEDQFSHAVLLHGLSGYGGLPVALFVASYLVCRDRQLDGPCGHCVACHKSFRYIHPDIHFAFPVVSKPKIERKDTISTHFLKQWREALNQNVFLTLSEWVQDIVTKSAKPDINVAECNEIMHQLNLQSFEDGARVQIIWMAEYLGNNGNRLLKLIEEPPKGTYIILICEDENAVLNTIKSRCRMIAVPRIDQESIKKSLIENHDLSDARAEQIAFLSEGDYSMALGLLGVEASELLALTLKWLDACHTRDAVAMRDWTDKFNGYNNQNQKAILAYALKLMREFLHAQVMGRDHLRLSHAEIEAVSKTSLWDVLDLTRIEKMSEILSDTLFFLGRNAHVKTLMYNSCLQIESTLNK